MGWPCDDGKGLFSILPHNLCSSVGFLTALTHVATGPAFEGRNSINITHPLDKIYQVTGEGEGEPSALSFNNLPPVTCQSLLLMPNILGYDSYSINRLWLYVMKL